MSEGVEESFEQSSSTTASKRAKRKTSVLWDNFDKLPDVLSDGKIKVACKLCQKYYILPPRSGTSNLKYHLDTVHKSELADQPQGKGMPVDQTLFRERISRAIVRHNYPFSYVEHKETRGIHSFLNPSVKHISRNTAKSDILKMYAREMEFLNSELSLIPSRVCLTSDLWKSLASNGYMCVTAHYVDLEWTLQKRVIIFRHVPPPHSGFVLCPLLISFLKEWGIEKKVFSITLDNATYNNGVVDTLKEHLSLVNSVVCEGKFLHVRCANHVLNLIVQAVLEHVDIAITKIREGVKYIKHSEARILKFVECIKDFGLPCSKKLRQDIPIRWNSTYLMLESALLYRHAYIHYKLIDNDFKHALSEEEWKKVGVIADFLKPFHDITTLFSGSKYPTANLYLPNVFRIEMMLEQQKTSQDKGMSLMATLMLEKFKKYWESYSVILSIAIVLDPRYKLRFVQYCYTKLSPSTADENLKVFEENLHLLFKEYLIPSTTTTSLVEHASGSASKRVDDAFVDYDVFESELEASQGKTQLDLCLTSGETIG